MLLPAVCLIAGIIIGEYVTAELPLLPIFIGSVMAALLLWKYELLQSGAIMVCLVMLGWLLMSWQKESLTAEWPDGEVRYEAVVMSEPVEKPKTMAVDILLTANGRKLKCYLYKDDRSRNLRIGDGLKIQSRIQDDRTFVASWKWQKAEISLSNLSRLERTRLFFLQLRSRLLSRLRPHLTDSDAYAVIAAMTLGDKSALTSDVKDVYSVTGASHVLALSGLHLGIIYSLLSLFVYSRRWQMASQVLLILSIWAFVFLVGMTTSVVRSAVMLSVYALMSLGKRDRMSVNTLAFTAIVMLMVSPMSLFDVGFQMSYLAVLSILLVLPLMEGLVSRAYLMDHRFLKWGYGLIGVSLAAQIGVAPLIAYYFGRFSTYFLLTNFIVIPTATLILYSSMVVLAVPALAYILLYMVSGLNAVLAWVSTIPGASIEGLHPTILQTAMIYVIIAAVYLLIVRLRR